jgi:hypothetical protein
LKSLSNVIEEARSNWITGSQICLRDMSTQDWICGAHFSLAHFTRLAGLATARYEQVKENHSPELRTGSRNQQYLLQLAIMSAPQSVQCFGKKKTGELRASHLQLRY